MRDTLTVIAITFLCGTVAACGSHSPAAPTSASFAGTWIGNLGTSTATSALRLMLTQSGDALSGSWAITDQNAQQTAGGTVTGRVVGSAMTAVLALVPPTTCPFSVSGTLDAAGSRMTGTIATVGCTGELSDFNLAGSVQGGFTAMRQRVAAFPRVLSLFLVEQRRAPHDTPSKRAFSAGAARWA